MAFYENEEYCLRIAWFFSRFSYLCIGLFKTSQKEERCSPVPTPAGWDLEGIGEGGMRSRTILPFV